MPWLLFSRNDSRTWNYDGRLLGLREYSDGAVIWAWDPVENSSFIPWLVIVAAIHTMIAQKRTGYGFKNKSDIVYFVISACIIFNISDKKGILGDSSVHSFVDPGYEVYLALIVFISLFTLISLFAIFYRYKSSKLLVQNQ